MKSVVTGGAGFIGSHIVDALINKGHEVIVIDNESSESHNNFYYNSKASYYKLDIADYESTKDLYNNADFVFHCAAESRIQPAIFNPLLTIRTNVLGTGTVLQCSREAGVKKVIYSSTSSAYGRNSIPFNENMNDDCLNTYSVCKTSGEKLCSTYTQLFNLKTIILRYFNVYGDREPLKGPYAPVVGLFLRQEKAGESLTIVPDGSQRRDFTHIDDVVRANIAAMEIDDHSRYGEVFNVGTGKNYSIIELANLISKNIKMIGPRLGEAQETLADIKKIKETFGWEPKNTLAEYILKKLG